MPMTRRRRFAHAGMTAEGDNRVLMQKVAKELLTTVNTPRVRARIQVNLQALHPIPYITYPIPYT